MLLSMTGYGDGQIEEDGLSVSVEMRTVNNRYLKISYRLPEGYNLLETRIDSIIRQRIRRGSVQLNLRLYRESSSDDLRINETVLTKYHDQLQKLARSLNQSAEIQLESLVNAPGVVDEVDDLNVDTESEWPVIEKAVQQALSNLCQMRANEGMAMSGDMEANRRLIAAQLTKIKERAPQVVQAYQERLTDRLNRLLDEYDVQVQPGDVVREVGIFAERADISEETVRLDSHLEQFAIVMKAAESSGRKLEFLVQEMFRETNTIGSKANNAEIAQHVVEIKTVIERLREMIQNVE